MLASSYTFWHHIWYILASPYTFWHHRIHSGISRTHFDISRIHSGISKSILSYTILSYTILYYPILSYPILYYPILYYPILYYPILSYTLLSILYYDKCEPLSNGFHVFPKYINFARRCWRSESFRPQIYIQISRWDGCDRPLPLTTPWTPKSKREPCSEGAFGKNGLSIVFTSHKALLDGGHPIFDVYL